MIRTTLSPVFLAAALLAPSVAQAGAVSAEGRRLAQALDAMHVEQLWLSGRYVDWKTGQPLDRPINDHKPHTHCSAFVAAACLKLGVYILRPPEHGAHMLANAQFDWLQHEGAEHGWRPVKNGWEAQQLANEGRLVVASHKEADGKRSGHIAIVRPSGQNAELVRPDGPSVIQAGKQNFRRASLRRGFSNHAEAMIGGVRYFAHPVMWE
jgi:hypothetical protein